METGEGSPWWLEWVVPVVAGVTAIGAALIWIGRIILLPGIKLELEELLKEKFDEAQEVVDRKHKENQQDIKDVRNLIKEGDADRKQIRKDLSEVVADVAYLRGKSSGNYKR